MHPLTILCAAWGFVLTAAATIHIVSFVVVAMHYAATDYYEPYWSSLEGFLQAAVESKAYQRLVEDFLNALSWFGIAATIEYAARILSEARRIGPIRAIRRGTTVS